MLITFEVDRHDRLKRAEPLPPRDNALMHGADQNVGHFHLQQEMLGWPVTQHFKPAIDKLQVRACTCLRRCSTRASLNKFVGAWSMSVCALDADYHRLHLQRGDPRPQRGISVQLWN